MTSPGSKGISEGDVEHVIRSTQSSWDRKIATDLISEMAAFFGEVDTVPQMRQALAIAGYHELQRLIEKAIEGKAKLDAVRSMAFAMRSFALGSPGLAVASFRNPDIGNPESQKAAGQLANLVLQVFGEAGIKEDAAKHAIRILKSIVRGFVMSEMSAPVAHPIEYQKSYVLAIEMFTYGLDRLGDLSSTKDQQ